MGELGPNLAWKGNRGSPSKKAVTEAILGAWGGTLGADRLSSVWANTLDGEKKVSELEAKEILSGIIPVKQSSKVQKIRSNRRRGEYHLIEVIGDELIQSGSICQNAIETLLDT